MREELCGSESSHGARRRCAAWLLACCLLWQGAGLSALGATKSAAAVAPQTEETVTVFGPRRVERAAPQTRAAEQFALPPGVVGPFTLSIQNGAAGGTNRVLLLTARLNGEVVVGPDDFNAQVPALTRSVSLLPANTLELSFGGRGGSFVVVTVTGRRFTNAGPPVVTSFSPTHGPVGTQVNIDGTSLTSNGGTTTVSFAGSDNTRQQAAVVSSSATRLTALVPNGAVTGTIEVVTSAGTGSSATPFTVDASQDFRLTLTPSTTQAVQRASATQLVHLTSEQESFSQLAQLSVTGLPQGVTAAFEPPQLTAGSTSTLTLSLAAANLPPGSFAYTVSATATVDGAPLVRTAAATLDVLAAGQTTLAGRVLSTDGDPVMGATASLDGRTATTDAAGSFLLAGVTAGAARPVMIDGRTASAPNRTYPVITEPADVVAGQANVVPFTFYLPPIDVQFERELVPGQSTVVGHPAVEGLAMTVPANANLHNRDGSPVTRVSITPLDIDRTPAPLPPDISANMVYTSQPGGALADAPIPVVYPNTSGADPGTRVALYAFNHDTVQWYVYGHGRVSDDGRLIVPEPGVGLRDFSWHFPDEDDDNETPKCNSSVSCCETETAHPVGLSNGFKYERTTDINIEGARGGLELRRIYSSNVAQACDTCPFGRGTRHNYDIRVAATTSQNAVRLVMPDEIKGRLYSLVRTDPDGSKVFTSTATPRHLGDVLKRMADGSYLFLYKDGRRMQFGATGRLTTLTDRNGNSTTLAYSGGKLTRVTDAVGRSLTLEYNSDRITRVNDPLGRAWTYTYDGILLASAVDPSGHTTRYGYDLAGRVQSVTDARGNATKTITYNSRGHVAQQRFADGGVERFDYVLSGNQITSNRATDPLGRATTRRFNAPGYLLSRTDALGQTATHTVQIGTNLPLATSGPCGCPQAARTFDARGNLTGLTDRLGQTETREYEQAFNNVTRRVDRLGRVTLYTYDVRGNLLSTTDPLGRVRMYAYDADGQRTSATDPLGHTTRYEYDARGNLSARIDALGNRTAMEYDLVGRMTSLTDPLGRRTAYAYDASGRMTSQTDPAGATTSYSYDDNDNLVRLTDAQGHTWRRTYDAKNRLTSETDPLGRVTAYEYDRADQLTAVVSPSGRRLQYTYDARGQRQSVRDGLGHFVRFEYDNQGNMVALSDQRGNKTSFVYDQLFRLVTVRNPVGEEEKILAYDAEDNILERQDRLSRRVAYAYDGLNRPTRVSYLGTQPGDNDPVVTYAYDEADRRTRIDDTEAGSIRWDYDAADRVTAETTTDLAGAAEQVTYTYNAAGQLATMQLQPFGAVSYTYDPAARLQTIAQGGDTFTYAYDSLSRLTSLQRPNGVSTTYVYNAAGRLTRLLHARGASQPIEDFRYAYNDDDEIETIDTLGGGSLIPDAKTAGPADEANRIRQFETAAYGFDPQGQTTSKTVGPDTTLYHWDERGRLRRVTLPDGQTVAYDYDALGRRTRRTAAGLTTRFVYDGQDVILDKASGGEQVYYLNGPGIDNKLRQSSSPANPFYFLQDHLRSTVGLTNGSGVVVETQRYEAFGRGAGGSLTRYAFTGREHEPATGLTYYRARWYDTQQGRFISEDPIGPNEDGSNFYVYANNSPLNGIDPSGMATVHIWYPSGIQAGHVSMTLDDGTYISWWPERKCVSCPRTPHDEFWQDVLGEGRGSDETVPVEGLDEEGIRNWWDAYKRNNKDWSLGQNCADTVEEGLKSGGAPEKFWSEMIDGPMGMIRYLQYLQAKGYKVSR